MESKESAGQRPAQKSYKKALRMQKECCRLYNFYAPADWSAATPIKFLHFQILIFTVNQYYYQYISITYISYFIIKTGYIYIYLIHFHNIVVNALAHSMDCGGCRLVCSLGYLPEFDHYYINCLEFDPCYQKLD